MLKSEDLFNIGRIANVCKYISDNSKHGLSFKYDSQFNCVNLIFSEGGWGFSQRLSYVELEYKLSGSFNLNVLHLLNTVLYEIEGQKKSLSLVS